MFVFISQCYDLVMETNNKMYQDLFKLYKHAYSKKVVANCQVEFNQMWKDKIKKGKDNLDIEAYQSESARLKEMIHKNKPSSILSFFRKKTSAIPKEPTPVEIEMVEIVSTTPEPEVIEDTYEHEAESSLIETVVDCTKETIANSYITIYIYIYK